MKFSKLFLSHAHVDKAFVLRVADALARLGLLPWVDCHELFVGQDLPQALEHALRDGGVCVPFLSRAAVASSWVDDELTWALRLEDTAQGHVIPVFLDPPLEVVRSQARLRRWLHADGDRISRSFVQHPDPGHVAEQLAQSLYEAVGLCRATDATLVVDQRRSERRGVPRLHRSFMDLDSVALTLRPAYATYGDEGEVRSGNDWLEWSACIQRVVRALGSRRAEPRKVRILGQSQLAVPFLLGRLLDRTEGCDLYAYARDGSPLRLNCAPLDQALQGGAPWCARPHPELSALGLPEPTPGAPLNLLILQQSGEECARMHSVAAFLRQRAEPCAAAWIPHGSIDSTRDVMKLASEVRAFESSVKPSHVNPFTTLPFHALPLFGALLAPHVLPRLTFMEFERTEGTYLPLPIPVR